MIYENEADTTTPAPSDRSAPGPDSPSATSPGKGESPGTTAPIPGSEEVEPGETGDFSFASFQLMNPDEVPCDVEEEEEEVVICPACVPDPNWEPDFNWKLDSFDDFTEIYLDEATCEYVMITEEAVSSSDLSKFRNLGLASTAAYMGDDAILSAPKHSDHDPEVTRSTYGDADSGLGQVQDAMKVAKLVTYNNTGCTNEPDADADVSPDDRGDCKVWHDRLDAYKAHAVREIMFHYQKLVNDETYIAMYSLANPTTGMSGIDWFKDPARQESSLIRVRVAIPVQYLDALPSATPESESDKLSPTEEVTITGHDIDRKVNRLKEALELYAKYQAYWFQTDGGSLFVNWGGTSRERLYLDSKDGLNQRSRLENFTIRLESFLNDVGYKFMNTSIFWEGNFHRDRAAEVKIQFDDKMKISGIYAKKEGCDFELLGGLKSDGTIRPLNKSSFKVLRNRTGPGVGYYIGKLHDIDFDLRAREAMPWLDFVKKYTYPSLDVDFGAGLPDQSVLGCFLKNEGYGEFFDCVLDQLVSLPDAIAFKFQQEGCQLLTAVQKASVDSAEAAYKERTDRVTKMKAANDRIAAAKDALYGEARGGMTVGNVALFGRKGEGSEEKAMEAEKGSDVYASKDARREHEGDRDLLEIAKKAKKAEEKRQDELKANWLTGADKDLKKATRMKFTVARKNWYKDGREGITGLPNAGFKEDVGQTWDTYVDVMSQFGEDKDLAKAVKKIADWKESTCGVFPRDGDLIDQMLPDWMQKILLNRKGGRAAVGAVYKSIFSRLGICGMMGLLLTGMECLFAGISFGDALMIIIKAAMKDLPPYSLARLYAGLPPDKQFEIEEKVRAALKEINITTFFDLKSVLDASEDMLLGGSEENHASLEAKLIAAQKQLEAAEKLHKDVMDHYLKYGHTDLEDDTYISTYKPGFEGKRVDIPTIADQQKTTKAMVDAKAKYYDITGEQQTAKKEGELMYHPGSTEKKPLPAYVGEAVYADKDFYVEEGDSRAKSVEKVMEKWYDAYKDIEALVEKLEKDLETSSKIVGAGSEAITESIKKTFSAANATGVDSYGNPTGGGAAGNEPTLGKAVGNVVAPILKAYAEAIIDTYKDVPEELLNEFNRIPGAQLVAQLLLQTRCPRQPLFHPPMFEWLNSLDFKFCKQNGKVPVFPVMRPIPFGDWKVLIKKLVEMAIEELWELIAKLALALVIKMFQSVYNAICKLLRTGVNIAATSISNAIKGEATDVYRIFVESFCGPQATEEEVAGVLSEIFAASGAAMNPPGQPPGSGDYIGPQSFADGDAESYAAAQNDVVTYFEDMFGDMGQQEAVDMLFGKATKDTYAVGANLAKNSNNAVIRETFSNPENVQAMMRTASTLMPEEAKQQLMSLNRLLPDDDGVEPFNASFCATDKEAEDFYDSLRNNLTPFMSGDQADQVATSYYDDMLKQAQKIADLIQSPVFDPDKIPSVLGQPDPTAAADPCGEDGQPKHDGLVPREPAAVTSLGESALSKLFDAIEDAYAEDLLSPRRKHGIFNYILSDSVGMNYLDHVHKTTSRDDYVNSRDEVELAYNMINGIEDKDAREAATIKVFGEKKISRREYKKLMNKSTGYLPKTIGRHLRGIFDDFAPADLAGNVLGEEVATPRGCDVKVELTIDVDSAELLTNEDAGDTEDLNVDKINVLTNKYTEAYIADHKKSLQINAASFIGGTSTGETTSLGTIALAEETICSQTAKMLQRVANDPGEFRSAIDDDFSAPGSLSSLRFINDIEDDFSDYSNAGFANGSIDITPSNKKMDIKLYFNDRNFENAWTTNENNKADWACKWTIGTSLFDAMRNSDGDIEVLDPGSDGDIGQIKVWVRRNEKAKVADEVADYYSNEKEDDEERISGPFEVDRYSTPKFLVSHTPEVVERLTELATTTEAPNKPPVWSAFVSMLKQSIEDVNGGSSDELTFTKTGNTFFTQPDYNALMTNALNGFMNPLGSANKDAWLYGYDPNAAFIPPTAFEFGVINKRPTGPEPEDGWSNYEKFRRDDFDDNEFRPMHRSERRAKVMPITRYEFDKGKPHPRVHVLNPAQYGGSYDNPPIYIAPYVRNGRLGFLDKMMPEWDGCEPRKGDLVNLNDIKDRVNDLNRRLPDDERLKFDEGCLVEEPYARILNRFSSACIEGAVKALIRIVISEHFINAYSTFTTFKMSNDVFDEGFAAFIASNVKSSILDKAQPWFDGPLSSEELWLAFLEICVQIWNRKYAVLEEISEADAPPQLVNALAQLNDIIENYANPHYMNSIWRDDIWPRNKEHLAAAKARDEVAWYSTLKTLRQRRNLSIVAKTQHLASLFLNDLIKEEMKHFSVQVETLLDIKFKFKNITEYFLDNLSIGSTKSFDRLYEVVSDRNKQTSYIQSKGRQAAGVGSYLTMVEAEEAGEEIDLGTGSEIESPFQKSYDDYHYAIFEAQDKIEELEGDEHIAAVDQPGTKKFYDMRVNNIGDAIDEASERLKKQKEKLLNGDPDDPSYPNRRSYSEEQFAQTLKDDDDYQDIKAEIKDLKKSLENPTEKLDDVEDKIAEKEAFIETQKREIKRLVSKVKQGGFVLQKYAIVKDRLELLEEAEIPEREDQFPIPLPDYVVNRPDKYRGVVSLEQLAAYLSEMPDEDKTVRGADGTDRPALFSDYFSTFEFMYEISLGDLRDADANMGMIEAYLEERYSTGPPTLPSGADIDIPSPEQPPASAAMTSRPDSEKILLPIRFIPDDVERGNPVSTQGEMGIEFGIRLCYYPSETRGGGAFDLIQTMFSSNPEMQKSANDQYLLSVPAFRTREYTVEDRWKTEDVLARGFSTTLPELTEADKVVHRTVSNTTPHKNTRVMILIDHAQRDLIDRQLQAPSADVLAEAEFSLSDKKDIEGRTADTGDYDPQTEKDAHASEKAYWQDQTTNDRYMALFRGHGTMDGIYDLPCLRDEFAKSSGLKVITEYVLKLKRLTSMAAIYNSIAFPWSILQVTGSPEEVAKGRKELIRPRESNGSGDYEKWRGDAYGWLGHKRWRVWGARTFEQGTGGLGLLQGEDAYSESLLLSKRLFKYCYVDRDFTDPDRGSGKTSFKELLKGLFGPNLDQSMKWWNRTRRRPFNALDENCKDDKSLL